MGDDIKKPHTFYYYNFGSSSYGYCPNNTPYYNSWSAKNKTLQSGATSTDNIVVKTIYDPCPAGYTVAPVNAFSEMTDKNGWNSTDKGSLQQGCWFPASGLRIINGGDITQAGSQSRYWQAVPYSMEKTRYLYLASSSANPENNYGRSGGLSVRPVAEKD